jgi:hypothetical protein
MRVYQVYRAYIHKSQVPFKELFFFVNAFLKENSLYYREILFNFDIDLQQGKLDPVKVFLKKYPYWRDYSIKPAESNSFHRVTNAPEMCADLTSSFGLRNHVFNHKSFSLEKLLNLLSQVPRPLNLPRVSVRFDGIDWLQSGGDGSITFLRNIWPSGANFVVMAEIEITDPNNLCSILDDSYIISALNERFFGLLKSGDGRQLELSNEEEKRVDILKKKIEPAIIDFREQIKIEKAKYSSFDERLAASKDAVETKFSVKKPLKAFFKDWEYKFEQSSVFFMRKIIKHGFRIEVLVYFKPGFATELTREISISGLYFHFGLASDTIILSLQEAIDDFIADCRRIVDKAEQKLVLCKRCV